MKEKFIPALIAGVATLILAFPLLGLNLVANGSKLAIEGADAKTITYILLASLAVFLFQLFKDNLYCLLYTSPSPRD